MESGNIKPINRNSVHKICSGQVVLTLATAVKELVENSLDAGATIIEVKLKEYGSELVEVIDNGKGVKASDFQSITLKHHTSKINDFCDVESVSTFGFRGEALSSLCALSNVEIITCHKESSIGSLLMYNHDGTLIKSAPTPRQVGTTVILKNLFFTLPVRHKEFLRNIKREFSKMIQLLTAYCLISVNKKITCSNITGKGKKSILLSTNNCTTLKESIASIFGSKQVNNMMEFVQQCPSDTILEEYFVPKSSRDNYNMFQIEGFISNSTHGEGRSSTDRQFFFINGRPCDLPKISKIINEIYHSFNKHQYPFVFLNITLTEGSADVNVTPDKRLIFIQEEKLLLCIVKTSLLQMYQIQPSQIKMSSPSLFFHKKNADSCAEQLEEKLPVESEGVEETLKRKINSNTSDFEESPPFSPPFKTLRKEAPSNIDQKSVEDEVSVQDSPDSGFLSVEGSSASLASYPSSSPSNLNSPSKAEQDKNQLSSVNMTLTLPFNEDKAFKGAPLFKSGNLKLEDILQKAYRGKSSFTNLTKTSNKTEKVNKSKTSRESSISKLFFKNMNEDKVNNEPETLKSMNFVVESISRDNCDKEISQSENVAVIEEEYALLDEYQSRRKKTKMITFDIETIKANFKLKKNSNLTESLGHRKFRSKIAPTDNQSAEEELKKEIRKEDFTKMDIIGQFNLGFIITRLNSDLFIIDQHATDEKYNFEMLQKETVLETQKLLNPQNLDLTAVSEAVLLDNLNIFEKSGFKFNISEEKSVGQKIQLVSVPVSHNWRFGKEDVDEMIFMLTDNPISMVRPSRVNQMFASRACRKSVMIGTALTVSMMKKLVFHMGEIEQPWNCPHGRPTMRHLLNLNILDQSSDN